MQHIWSIVCQKSIIDTDTNLISIIDSIEGFGVNLNKNIIKKQDEVTNISINFELVSFWFDATVDMDRKQQTKIELYDAQNNKIKEYQNDFTIPKSLKRMRSRMKISGFPFTVAGDYTFKIKIKEGDKYKEVATIPVEITETEIIKM